MTEEKENKGSYSLQIKIPNELKDKLEKKAEKAGVSLNQYIMYLFIDDIKEKCNYFYFSQKWENKTKLFNNFIEKS